MCLYVFLCLFCSPLSDLRFQLHSLCSLQSFFNDYFNLDIISSFMSLHFFLILSQKTSFKTAPQAWQVKNVKSACAADMTFQYVSHITCLSSCLFVSSIFPVCFLCFLVFVLLLAFSAPFNLCAHLNMQCCNAACI